MFGKKNLQRRRNKMIKEVEMIKMRKDIDHLVKNYFFTYYSLAEICGLAQRTIREFMTMNRSLSAKNIHSVKKHLHIIKEQIKEAEEYQPGETK